MEFSADFPAEQIARRREPILIGDREDPSAAVLDAVATGDVNLAISDDQLSELVTVIGYADIEAIIDRPVRAFEIALDVGTMGYMYHPRHLDWPGLSDPKDGWIFNLPHAADADYIVYYDEAVHSAASALEFVVVPLKTCSSFSTASTSASCGH
jgi:predicted nucleic acid-binding protein